MGRRQRMMYVSMLGILLAVTGISQAAVAKITQLQKGGL